MTEYENNAVVASKRVKTSDGRRCVKVPVVPSAKAPGQDFRLDIHGYLHADHLPNGVQNFAAKPTVPAPALHPLFAHHSEADLPDLHGFSGDPSTFGSMEIGMVLRRRRARLSGKD